MRVVDCGEDLGGSGVGGSLFPEFVFTDVVGGFAAKFVLRIIHTFRWLRVQHGAQIVVVSLHFFEQEMLRGFFAVAGFAGVT